MSDMKRSVSTQNSYAEHLSPNVTVFRGRPPKKQVKINKFIEWHTDLIGIVKKYQRAHSFHHMRTQQEGNYLQARELALTRNQVDQDLNLQLLASRV